MAKRKDLIELHHPDTKGVMYCQDQKEAKVWRDVGWKDAPKKKGDS